MDCREDLEFNDDSCRAEEKAKESILLMKKKMLRSHDLILQYNNKLKECERLKGDLCVAQEEVMKLRQESNANLAKVVKLELQSADYKKYQLDLERKLEDKDILIASDKSHLQQLVCKVEDIEDKNSEKLMEMELEKSALEGKIKNLEQELKSLKKSHQAEVNRLEKAKNPVAPKGRKGAIKFVKESKESGVDAATEVAEPAKPIKPATAEKCVMTNEFYHITDNPYPIFCDKCEALTEPSVEKICKIMTAHPPLLTEMLSPVRRRENPRSSASHSFQDPQASDQHHLDFDSRESNFNEFNRVDPISRNFVSPIEPPMPSSVARPLETTTVPEIEILRRKLETLERKIKKQKKVKAKTSADAQPPGGGCCGHSRSVNCCGHAQNHPNSAPNAFPNVQPDMMTEFWNRLMQFTNERAPKLEGNPRKSKKQKKIKLRRLKKEKTKKSITIKNCGSSNWEIESDHCEAETNVENSNGGYSHILRIKPNDVESKTSSRAEKKLGSRAEEFTENDEQLEDASAPPSPIKIVNKPEKAGRRKVPRVSERDDVEMKVASPKHEIVETFAQTSNSESSIIETKDLSAGVIFPNSSDSVEVTNFSQNSDSAFFSQSSATHESTSMSHDADSQRNSFDSNKKTASRIDVKNSNLHNSSHEKSVPFGSDVEFSDAPAEEHNFVVDCPNRSRGRKRKRSSSPKAATKRTTRSNLLGKLRALKKNSINGVVQTSQPASHKTPCDLSSETEETDAEPAEKDRASSISENEQDPRAPAKKQRIAHVPKTENTAEESQTPRMAKLRQVAKQICQNPGKRIAKRQTPISTRSSMNESKSEEESCKSRDQTPTPETREIVRTNLPVAVPPIRKRGRPRIVRKLPSDSPLPINQPKNNLPTNLPPSTSSSSEIPAAAVSSLVVNDSQEIDRKPETVEKSSQESDDEPLEEKIARTPLELRQENVASNLENSDTISVFRSPKPVEKLPTLEASLNLESTKDKSQCDEPAEFSMKREAHDAAAAGRVPSTGTEESDTPVSPASSSSLEMLHRTPAKIAVSPIRSPVYSNVKSIDHSATPSSSEFFDAKTSTIASDAPNSADPQTARSEEFPDLSKSILFAKLTETPTSTLQNAFATQESQETLSRRICDRREGEISATSSSASTSLDNFAAQGKNTERMCQDVEKVVSLPMRTEGPGRSLVVYDADMDDDCDEEFDSELASSPQIFPAGTCDTKKTKKPTKSFSEDCAEPRNVVKELRSRQVLSEPAAAAHQRNRQATKRLSHEEAADDAPEDRPYIPYPRPMLGSYLRDQRNKSKSTSVENRCAMKLQAAAEKTAKAELDKLIESEEWTSVLHQSVIASLREVHSIRTVAKSIVDLLVERGDLDEQLDRTYTPPAPVLTKTQQRLAALINDLERDGNMPGVSELVQNGITYTLFRLCHAPQFGVVEALVRMLTALARMKKDRERVRILFCDSLYCLGRKSMTVIYIALSIWPEVFPMHGSTDEELPNCLAHLIKVEGSGEFPSPRAGPLKKMITDFYNYPQFQARTGAVVVGLLNALQKNYSGDLEASILLLAKKEGTAWAYENIINAGLMKTINDNNYPSKFNALNLLGFVMRAFPLPDAKGVVGQIAEQLYKMMDENGEASPDQQEGVIAALLSLSRNTSHFDRIATTLLKWKPRQTLRPSTIDQINAFFKMRSASWWNQRHPYKMRKKITSGEKNELNE